MSEAFWNDVACVIETAKIELSEPISCFECEVVVAEIRRQGDKLQARVDVRDASTQEARSTAQGTLVGRLRDERQLHAFLRGLRLAVPRCLATLRRKDPCATLDARALFLPEAAAVFAVNPSVADAHRLCSDFQVRFEEKVAKLGRTTFKRWVVENDPVTDDEKHAMRDRALLRASKAASRVAASFAASHGLVMPQSATVLAAFFDGLSPFERAEMVAAGISPAGILERFDETKAGRRPHFDARLHFRFRYDVPELVTVLVGSVDGLHWGYFFDHPAHPPCGVAHSYRRGEGTSFDAPTGLSALRAELKRRQSDLRGNESSPGQTSDDHRLKLLFLAIERFDEADRTAAEQDQRAAFVPFKKRNGSGDVAIDRRGASVVTAPTVPMPGTDEERAATLVAMNAAAARGQHLDALQLGRALWAIDEVSTEVAEILAKSYEALGRGALAEIVRVHARNRDLPSVDVYDSCSP